MPDDFECIARRDRLSTLSSNDNLKRVTEKIFLHKKMDNERAAEYIILANSYADVAFWQVKAIDREAAERLGISEAVQELLGLLQKVDGATMDIAIKINRKRNGEN